MNTCHRVHREHRGGLFFFLFLSLFLFAGCQSLQRIITDPNVAATTSIIGESTSVIGTAVSTINSSLGAVILLAGGVLTSLAVIWGRKSKKIKN